MRSGKLPSTAGRFDKNANKAGGVALRISSKAFEAAPIIVVIQ